jgi:hypothetical protein
MWHTQIKPRRSAVSGQAALPDRQNRPRFEGFEVFGDSPSLRLDCVRVAAWCVTQLPD